MTGAADAVDVLLGEERHVVVDDAARRRHVQPARGDVGGHHHVGLAGRECRKRFLALALAAVAVDEHGLHLVASQCGRHPAGATARAAEDHHAASLAVLDERHREGGLGLVVDVMEVLAEVRTRFRRAGDLRSLPANEVHALRILQHLLHHRLHLPGHGGGVEEELPGLRRAGEDLLRLREEAHVEHAVGLVEHALLHERQRDGVQLAEFAHAARRSHQEIDAFLHHVALRRERALAVDRGGAEHRATEQLGCLACHLLRQLARGAEHQRAQAPARIHRAAAHLRRRLVDEALGHGQEVGECLAGAGGGHHGHVAPRQCCRDRGALHRRGHVGAHGGKRTHQHLGDAE